MPMVAGLLAGGAARALPAAPPAAAAAAPYELRAGEFPPAGSSHSIAGELISVDHVHRRGTLRPDRLEGQSRGVIDLPLAFEMLPYGSIYFHGAPASLKDIPLGTHLHGEFYWNAEHDADPARKQAVAERLIPSFHAFDRCLRLEDDFSRDLRAGRLRRIEQVDWSAGTLAVQDVDSEGNPSGTPRTYTIDATTTVWKGRGFGDLWDLRPGQLVLLNTTNCTRFGPGDCTDIWMDESSRELARERQLAVHRLYIRQRGLPGRIDYVDHQAGTVTFTLYDGFDPSLTEALCLPYLTATVADESLRTYDQVNVSKGGPITDIKNVPVVPGCGGLQITFRPSDLLEGFRPQRHVRVFLATWSIGPLPREEELRR